MTHLALLLAQASKSPAGGGIQTLVLLAIVILFFYFVMIRPQQKRMRRQKQLLGSLEVGDDVMTVGGFFGTIKEIDDDTDEITVEIAPGVNVRMVRNGIARKQVAEEEEGEEADEGS